MTVDITHQFVSQLPDSATTGIVHPSGLEVQGGVANLFLGINSYVGNTIGTELLSGTGTKVTKVAF